MRHIVVGVDTGRNAAIACIDLDGRLVFSAHKRDAGISWFVSSIAQVGTPSLIATDKTKQSATLRKIAAVFNVRISYPDSDILISDKLHLSRRYAIKNSDERDAFAAATSTYNKYKNKLKQASSIVCSKKIEDNDEIDRIKALVIARHSINEAILNKKVNRR